MKTSDLYAAAIGRYLANLSDDARSGFDPTSSRGEVEMSLVSKQTPSNYYYYYHYYYYYYYYYFYQ